MAGAPIAQRRVGIWIRVSTEDQAQGDSPEHHERRAQAYAEGRGWDVVDVYRLEGVSGKAVMTHPETQRMLGDIRKGHVEALIFSKLARLARNTRDLLEFAEIFRDCNADMVSLAEAIDTSTPSGRLFFTMIAAMAQWEREEIADRVAASVPIRAKLGKPLGGPAPYGYRWVDKKLEVHPDEAPIRKLMYELFAQHRRLKRVARLINERGFRTRKGALFSDTTIRRLLEDGSAKGLRRANYSHANDRGGGWTLKPESEWVFQQVPAIVSEELWDTCNSILSDGQERWAKRGRPASYLFTGFAFCECGQKMYVWANSPKYRCPACQNKIPIADLEEVFRGQLEHFLLSPAETAAHAQAAREVVREKEALIEAARAELRKVQTDEDDLFALHLRREIPTEGFGLRYNPIAARRKELDEEIPRLQAECDLITLNLLNQEEAIRGALDLTERWDRLEHNEKRQIVETITDRIVVGREEVEINLLHVPQSGNAAGKATSGQGFCAAISCTRAG
ncbi:MAG TPA: recombinase family protein [Caulobacteraceae bacterium]|jgi:site-specific DNA recombinase